MPPPSNSAALHLIVLPEPFFVVKLKPGQEIAPCLIKDLTSGKGGFFSVTRTSEEVSVVGESYKWMPSSYKEQSTWMAIKIQGPMEHSVYHISYDLDNLKFFTKRISVCMIGLTGIMASLTAPLKLAKVPVFALSTWSGARSSRSKKSWLTGCILQEHGLRPCANRDANRGDSLS